MLWCGKKKCKVISCDYLMKWWPSLYLLDLVLENGLSKDVLIFYFKLYIDLVLVNIPKVYIIFCFCGFT